MAQRNPTHRIGDAEVTRIDELVLRAFTPATLYPGGDPDALSRHRHRLGAGSVEAGDILVQRTHAWLVRLPGRVVLIDTAAGDDKERPEAPVLHHLREPFLARLAAAGIDAAEVDTVLLTHLHSDHVGWNTRLVDGAWVPTFPNARHVFSRKEDVYGDALARGEEPDPDAVAPGLGPMRKRPARNFYDDSVRPVIAAGLADRIAVDGTEAVPGFAFLPSPGHSIDHASIRLVSRGEEALFAGDVLHHPLQVYEPGLHSRFCEFPEAALRSRLWALGYAADRKIPLFSSHFAESAVGHVSREGVGYAWTFL